MELSKTDLKLIIHFLSEAADEYSNHGCNDFNLDDYISKEERENFISEINSLPLFDEPLENTKWTMDWMVMIVLAEKCKKLLEEKQKAQ